ncbi:MAG: DUF4288 domain-containing protein [Taibaiella sp.]|nr:DUF4288 domain-containing protein [Taibaiella sp.]
MNTFVAQIIYSIECEGMPTDQYEEEWRLVYADNNTSALNEAQSIARNEEATIIDRHGRTVCWRLLAVKDLQPVNVENGALLFSAIREVTPIAAPIWIQ